jgi:hypothetical protein
MALMHVGHGPMLGSAARPVSGVVNTCLRVDTHQSRPYGPPTATELGDTLEDHFYAESHTRTLKKRRFNEHPGTCCERCRNVGVSPFSYRLNTHILTTR